MASRRCSTAPISTLRLGGLTPSDAGVLPSGATPEATARLHDATAGNPLALLELAADADSVALAPEGAPLLVGTRITRSFLRRVGGLDDRARARSRWRRPATAAIWRCWGAQPSVSVSICRRWPRRSRPG